MDFIIHFFFSFLFLLLAASQLITFSIQRALHWSSVSQKSSSNFTQHCKLSILRLANWTLSKLKLKSNPASLHVQKTSKKKKS